MTNKRRSGFTLIELSLVMAFLSVLLVAIIITTLQMGKLYTKGITNRDINQIGRDLSDTLRRDFLTASSSRIVIPPVMGTGTATSGRVCLGTVSYVWNTADLLNAPNASAITRGSTAIVFERVIDPSNKLCTVQVSGKYITDIAGMTSTSLLAGDGRSLAVYDLSPTQLVTNGDNGLYDIKITIGTNDPSATDRDVTQGVICKPPSDSSSDFNYCSVAEFDVTVRTGGEVR
ncbi:MAG: prepilin-type N-terminal cleavage/methylation domain-containing protein [Candidatus Saccharimonas sp.]